MEKYKSNKDYPRDYQLILDAFLIKLKFFDCSAHYALPKVFVSKKKKQKKNVLFEIKKDENWFRTASSLHVFTFMLANKGAGRSKKTIECKE